MPTASNAGASAGAASRPSTPAGIGVDTGGGCCILTLSDHPVAKQADTLDLNLDAVAVPHEQRGVAREPTPSGVPVAMMSPGTNVISDERCAPVKFESMSCRSCDG